MYLMYFSVFVYVGVFWCILVYVGVLLCIPVYVGVFLYIQSILMYVIQFCVF